MATLSISGIILRFLLGGGAVVACHLVSKTLGSKWGGVFAAFPAVFLAALLALRLDATDEALVKKSVELSQGAVIGMLIDIFCAMAVVYFSTKQGWKRGMIQAFAGWFFVSLVYAVLSGYF